MIKDITNRTLLVGILGFGIVSLIVTIYLTSGKATREYKSHINKFILDNFRPNFNPNDRDMSMVKNFFYEVYTPSSALSWYLFGKSENNSFVYEYMDAINESTDSVSLRKTMNSIIEFVKEKRLKEQQANLSLEQARLKNANLREDLLTKHQNLSDKREKRLERLGNQNMKKMKRF